MTNYVRLPIALYRGADLNSEYDVTIPDLPNCSTSGETLERALENAKEAALLRMEEIIFCGRTFPELLPIEEHLDNPDYENCSSWAEIDVDISGLKKLRAGKN
ncbi:MAG: hypothetical protein HOB14_12750 [Gammaproteobacteria bacterium]|jgi:predicted RNase H-like HicB family nuclease|nr:hypothetical protein [Gammaproteobacteria bacterium]MBT4196794.1 hypothetical protein [Gammaproteobacteria bacterium]MBT6702523.1 hypothetical protein [Gammaproteobacteria bacterium]MBT7044325.1 hypothetical protein [Gammaproteobacteria bacterium]